MFAEWRVCRVSIDYHVEVEAHYYSVPHRFVRTEVEVRFTARTVEIFHKGERIAAHQRMSGNHKHTTVLEHIGLQSSALRRLDHRAHPQRSSHDRAGLRGALRSDPR